MGLVLEIDVNYEKKKKRKKDYNNFIVIIY